MDVIALARQLGHAIQEMESSKEMMALSDECDTDTELQAKVDRFNALRVEINAEIMKDVKDDAKVNTMDTELRKLYDEIMTDTKMMKLNEIKDSFSGSINFVNQIISASANGENPDTVEMESSSCGGSCSSCGGCH
ncbi:MAG: YlbF family regulator [Oscillospiraceae bacterium]